MDVNPTVDADLRKSDEFSRFGRAKRCACAAGLVEVVGDDGELEKDVEGDDAEGVLVGSFKHDGAGGTCLKHLQPAGGADAPAVASLEAGKAGVERSLPRRREVARNSSLTMAQTVWTPRSSGPVLQQPSR